MCPRTRSTRCSAAPPTAKSTWTRTTRSLGAWRYANLTDRGWAHYLETGYFLFDNHPRYELLRQQFGYDNEEYAFYWLDPLY